MADRLKKYEDLIERASKRIEDLLDSKETDKEEKLQYWKAERTRVYGNTF
jgi:hypothetical protein